MRRRRSSMVSMLYEGNFKQGRIMMIVEEHLLGPSHLVKLTRHPTRKTMER
jgi:hypothetical protein